MLYGVLLRVCLVESYVIHGVGETLVLMKCREKNKYKIE